ncbi:PREDICTED: uncharacterized protein LOC109156515 [Ipomoea nil]|uniref:uncharacterized protein LOC109156515 n=1 Tax=Ipomoea nil TaxID=35883 RepID=UPI000901E3D0|nr:PREDICTED: uncharacterized protein LOC109156515 [Ipomoea nil]
MSLFYYSQDSVFVYVLVYVDDILVMGSSTNLVNELLTKLSTEFKIRDLDEPGFFLEIETVKCDNGILLSQQRYMTDILNRAESRELHAFSDSDWAGLYPEDRKSTSGYAVFLGSNLMSWVCKKQRTVARSPTEAEYKALVDVCAEVIWILSLLREIDVNNIYVPKLWCDNLGATYMCANLIFHARIKHVEIDYHFVRDRVANGDIQVHCISTKDQLADIFTKAQPGHKFSFLRDKLQVTSVPCA